MSDRINHRMTAKEWGLLIFLSLLWGGAYFFNGVAVRELPTFSVVAVRVVGGALTLLIVLRALRLPLPRAPAAWRMFLVMGLLNNVAPFSLIVWGQAHIAAGVASILNATTPLFTVVVAHWLTTDEKLTGAKAVGVVVGFLGVAAMIGGDAVLALGDGVAGQIACLGAALSYAFAAIYGRRFRRMGVAPLAGATGQVTASALVLTPLALAIDRPWTLASPSAEVWGALAGIAVLSTALGYIVYFRLLATAGAGNAMLVTMLIPASAILLAALFLGETLGANHFVGLALIGAGLAAIDGRPVGFLRRAKRI